VNPAWIFFELATIEFTAKTPGLKAATRCWTPCRFPFVTLWTHPALQEKSIKLLHRGRGRYRNRNRLLRRLFQSKAFDFSCIKKLDPDTDSDPDPDENAIMEADSLPPLDNRAIPSR
jgi:hypothetical protein